MINNPKVSIYSLMIGSLIVGFWGQFSLSPSIVRLIFACSIYLCLFTFPYKNFFNNDFGVVDKCALLFLIFYGIILIFATIFNFDPDMYAFGNKYVSLFLNENCAPLLFPPLFCFYSVQKENFYFLLKSISVFLIVSLIMAVFGSFKNIAFTPIFIMPFFPYTNSKFRILILLSLFGSLYFAKLSARMLIIVVAFALLSLLFTYILKSKAMKAFFCTAIIATPLIFFAPILNLQKGEKTPIQEMLSLVFEGDEAQDTRSYLYIEMAIDLTKSNSWICGKGAYAHYFSEFEHINYTGEGEDYGRISSEVPFLNFLLHGGIIYISFYLLLFIIAVYKTLIYGKNKFVSIIAIITVGWYFNTFIGDIEGCRFYHLVFFFLIGCCFSNSILKSSDAEIQAMLDNQFYRLKAFKTVLLLKLIKARNQTNKNKLL